MENFFSKKFVCFMFSAAINLVFFKIHSALFVISCRLPMGVATMYSFAECDDVFFFCMIFLVDS
ncbi:MAG: hypothetical protein DMNBKLKJ_00023 [Candidatus Westeberhardia cardiocondylae]|nr:hypothetical protein [Candidatus Westeberhardia cardiocondylae]